MFYKVRFFLKKQTFGLLLILSLLFFIFAGCGGSNTSVPYPDGSISEFKINPEIIDPDFNNGDFTLSWETEFNRTYNYSQFAFYIIEGDDITEDDFHGDLFLGKGVLINKWQADYPVNTGFKTFNYDETNNSVSYTDSGEVVEKSIYELSGQLYALGVSTIVMYSGMADISYKIVPLNFANGAVSVQGWNKTSVNNFGFFNSSIAVDNNKNPHISYFKLDSIRYTGYEDGQWKDLQVSEVNVDSECSSSIAVGSDKSVHICYSEKTSADYYSLKYATKLSGDDSWGFITIEQSPYPFDNCLLYLNGSNSIALYTNGSALKLANNKNGNFEIEIVDSDAGKYSSLVFDGDGKINISYQSENCLKLITGTFGEWSDSIVIDPGIDTGYCNSIGCDSENMLHIGYYDYADGTLKYATNKSGSWRIKTVDNSVGENNFIWNEPAISILIDSKDKINLVYYNFLWQDLMLAVPNDDSDKLYYIDYSSDSGAWLSGTIDSADNIYISYYTLTSSSPRTLNYITGTLE